MSKQAKLPVSLLQPFDYLDKPASGYTSSSDEGNTWPEQETILAWLDKFSIAADNEQVYELAQALTAERVRLAIGLAEKVDKLQAQVDAVRKWHRKWAGMCIDLESEQELLAAINGDKGG